MPIRFTGTLICVFSFLFAVGGVLAAVAGSTWRIHEREATPVPAVATTVTAKTPVADAVTIALAPPVAGVTTTLASLAVQA